MKLDGDLKNVAGVYCIRNIINNKVYVGQSKDIYKRINSHIRSLSIADFNKCNREMYNDFIRYGLSSFVVSLLEVCSESRLELELRWMDILNSRDPLFGYNLRADSDEGMITHKKTSTRISENLKQQWKYGLRKDHGRKLKESWATDDDRKTKQSELLSKIKTKYKYKLTYPDGSVEYCFYNKLKGLGLKNVLSNFHRQRSNDVMCKGINVIRYVVDGMEDL